MSTLTRRLARLRPITRACAKTTLSVIAVAGAASFVFGAYVIITQEAVIGIFAMPLGLSSSALAIDELLRTRRP
ncbi:MAG: hypothetical protein AAF654_08700 [Myxococcota bacterium]